MEILALIAQELSNAEIARVHAANYGVYGARKVWLALNRDDTSVARCTVERLMRELRLEGARRSTRRRATIADPAAGRPADLVQRRFSPARPDAVWVADFTYVAIWSGIVDVAFVLDAHSRRFLGWKAATSMRTELVLDALEQAIWTPAREGVSDLSGLVCHNDAGAQGGFKRSSQHPDEKGRVDGTTAGWMTTRTGRPAMRSPGGHRPGGDVERAFWLKIAEGLSSEDTRAAGGRHPRLRPRPRRPLRRLRARSR